jgi:hypothetical protein
MVGTRPVRAANIVSRRIGEEFVLVPICASAAQVDSVYVLNEVGARTWELLDGSRTVTEICAAIVAEFEVDPEVVARDLRDFLADLEQVSAIALEP